MPPCCFFEDHDILPVMLSAKISANLLLALARCDKGSLILEASPVDLVGRISKSLQKFDKDVVRKDLCIYKNLPESMMVHISSTELDLVIDNLILNAIAHCPDDDIVAVIIDSEKATLSITNTAAMLSKKDLKLMFDRLWQKDPARAQARHSGLGLSLVRAYAELMQLQINASLTDKARFTITVSGFDVLR